MKRKLLRLYDESAVALAEGRLAYLRPAAQVLLERLQVLVDDGDVSWPEVISLLLGTALAAVLLHGGEEETTC